MLRKEKVRMVAGHKIELRMVIDGELKAKLDQLKALRSHKNPNMSYRELLVELAELGLKKWDPDREKSQRNVSGAEKPRMSAARATLTKQTTNRAAKQTMKQAADYGAKQAAYRATKRSRLRCARTGRLKMAKVELKAWWLITTLHGWNSFLHVNK